MNQAMKGRKGKGTEKGEIEEQGRRDWGRERRA